VSCLFFSCSIALTCMIFLAIKSILSVQSSPARAIIVSLSKQWTYRMHECWGYDACPFYYGCSLPSIFCFYPLFHSLPFVISINYFHCWFSSCRGNRIDRQLHWVNASVGNDKNTKVMTRMGSCWSSVPRPGADSYCWSKCSTKKIFIPRSSISRGDVNSYPVQRVNLNIE
jgi:hypothetical protein